MQTHTLSDDPTKAVKEMIAIIGTLNDVYARETNALERMDTKTFLSLQDTKLSVAECYAAGIRDLQSRADALAKIPNKLKNALHEMQEKFAALATRNITALDRTRRLTDRLGETIHMAARQSVEQQSTHGYGDTGHVHRRAKQAVSMGINEQA